MDLPPPLGPTIARWSPPGMRRSEILHHVSGPFAVAEAEAMGSQRHGRDRRRLGDGLDRHRRLDRELLVCGLGDPATEDAKLH